MEHVNPLRQLDTVYFAELDAKANLRPILTHEQIEQAIRDKYPKTPGERRCANEKKTMTELRQWYCDKLTKQNEDNAEFNRKLRTSTV